MDPKFLTRLNSLMAQRTFGKGKMFRRDSDDYRIVIYVREDLFQMMKFDQKTTNCWVTNYWKDKNKTTAYAYSCQ